MVDLHDLVAVRGRAACEYVNYKAMGLSLCVEDGKVAAVHVYSDVHGYKAFAGTLPFGLKVIMYAMERVTSEYESQGGGGSADMKAMVESSGGHSNPHTRTSSRTFPLLLPPLSHPPRVSMKAKEVVAALGEPDVKVGGGSSGAVTVIYSQLKPALQRDIGLQVTFVGRSWEDADNAIDSITLYFATDKS
ncbi:unnamed protein product [Closterium sp. NIES-64]|nr:unnamed protein product [Closterium sp. NIES-64]